MQQYEGCRALLAVNHLTENISGEQTKNEVNSSMNEISNNKLEPLTQTIYAAKILAQIHYPFFWPI